MPWRIAAEVDQRRQLSHIVIGQATHLVLAEHLRAEAPVDTQFTVEHPAIETQPVVQRSAGVHLCPRAFASRVQQSHLVELSVELAQVIESDPRLRQPRQDPGTFLSSQIAQQAITQALVGNRTQLFLDRLQGLAKIRDRAQAHREQTGEPTDGATQVDIGEQLLAPMSFQLYQA